ncbi:MAG: hypothetical protein P8Y04_03015 [Desulfobulbaceae bacterium]
MAGIAPPDMTASCFLGCRKYICHGVGTVVFVMPVGIGIEQTRPGRGREKLCLVQWFHLGSPHSIVEKVHLNEESPVGDFGTFEIHYY